MWGKTGNGSWSVTAFHYHHVTVVRRNYYDMRLRHTRNLGIDETWGREDQLAELTETLTYCRDCWWHLQCACDTSNSNSTYSIDELKKALGPVN
jgi:hypothetical protein